MTGKREAVISGYHRVKVYGTVPQVRVGSFRDSGTISQMKIQKFLDYQNRLKEWVKRNDIKFGEIIVLEFYFKMSTSWNLPLRKLKASTGHDHKPDVSELAESFMFACVPDREKIHTVIARKYWANEYKIVVSIPTKLNKRK